MSISLIIFLLILLMCIKSKDLALMLSTIMMPMIGTYTLTSKISLIFVVSFLFLVLYYKDICNYIKYREIYFFFFYSVYYFDSDFRYYCTAKALFPGITKYFRFCCYTFMYLHLFTV